MPGGMGPVSLTMVLASALLGAAAEPSFAPANPHGCQACELVQPKQFNLPTGDYPPPWELEYENSKAFAAEKAASRGHINRGFDDPFVVFEHRLLFCKIAKVASSGWLRLLRRMEGHASWAVNPYFMSPDGYVGGLRQMSHLSHAEALRVLRDSRNWTRIVIVRDPAERLLSAFLDKVHKPSESKTQIKIYSEELFGLPRSEFANVTFADFVERVAYGLTHSIVDQHWSLLSDQCDLRNWLPAYDLVIKMRPGDGMNEMLDCVLTAVARRSSNPTRLTELRDTFNLTSRVASNHATTTEKKYYTPQLLQRVMAMYAEDYALFNLPMPTGLL